MFDVERIIRETIKVEERIIKTFLPNFYTRFLIKTNYLD